MKPPERQPVKQHATRPTWTVRWTRAATSPAFGGRGVIFKGKTMREVVDHLHATGL